MMMTAIMIRNGAIGIGAERAATHHVRADYRRGERFERQGSDT